MYLEKPLQREETKPLSIGISWCTVIFGTSLLVFLALGSYQLDLPGLQYDEAKEAGLNAMQLVMGQPITAFRDATVLLGGLHVPLMVQDYIGALNVLLAAPFLAVGGVNVAALRWLPLLTGACTLWLAWRLALRLGGPVAASATAILLAVNPTFIFWNRQGIFVTNLVAAIFLASLLAALRWWQERRPIFLWLLAFCWGLGIYAKLLFVWAIGAMVLVGAAAWLLGSRQSLRGVQHSAGGESAAMQGVDRTVALPNFWILWLVAAACFLLPLLPLILFNVKTGGTLTSIFGNLGQSYYGVNNRAYWPNLLVRLGQVRILLEGNQFWYLGEVYANRLAPWLATGLIVAATVLSLVRHRRGWWLMWLPIVLLALIVAQSAFTVSDLFITHYALLVPLIPISVGLAIGIIWDAGRESSRPAAQVLLPSTAVLALFLWAGSDTINTVSYHRILASSGGYASHSDGIYRLAGYLVKTKPSAPLALDWGMDAQLRFLSRGDVNPVEVFGYGALDQPDSGFASRVLPFLDDPNTLYIAHVPSETVFQGRVQALARLAAEHGLNLREEARFGLRSGHALFIVYRATR
jgi:hypothetical protein